MEGVFSNIVNFFVCYFQVKSAAHGTVDALEVLTGTDKASAQFLVLLYCL